MSSNSVYLIDGIDPTDLGLLTFRRTQRPILPQTVDVVEAVPHRHGAYDFGGTLSPRQFTLEAVFNTRDYSTLQDRVSQLAAFLLDEDGRSRTMPIIFSNQPDKQYSVRYSGDLQIDRIAGLGVFTLPFVAYDPYAYSAWISDELNVDSLILVDSNVSVDVGYTYAINSPQTIEIQNYGSLAAKPLIVVTGSFTSFTMTLGGVLFSYNSPATGTLEIDFARMTVKLNGSNALQHTNARFGKLSRGTNMVPVGGSGLNIQIAVKYRMPYAA